MSRFDRFSSSYEVLKGPEAVQNIPQCLQATFQPTKTVEQEIHEHRMHLPKQRFLEGGNQGVIALAKFKEENERAYDSINLSLRERNHKQWENTIAAMNVAIRSNPAQHGILYRGIPVHAPQLVEGSTFVLRGFNSCSRQKDIAARKFAGSTGTVFQINNWRVGTEMETYNSGLENEYEVLLPPYLKLVVTDMGKYHEGGQTIQVDQV